VIHPTRRWGGNGQVRVVSFLIRRIAGNLSVRDAIDLIVYKRDSLGDHHRRVSLKATAFLQATQRPVECRGQQGVP